MIKTHSLIDRLCKACLFFLLFTLVLGLAHCSSSSGGGGGGPKYTCSNGTPSEGSPDGDSDVESCASCKDGYGLVDEVLCRKLFYLHSNAITILCPHAAFGESRTVNTIEYTKRARGDITLDNAATTCTSGITNMANMFLNKSTFNEDIGSWDVSSVTNMDSMFRAALVFNQDISSWDVSSVADMSLMFNNTNDFNKDISGWDVSSVTNMGNMFSFAAKFNQDLSSWCVSGIGPPAPTAFATGTPDAFGMDTDRQPQ